MESIRFFYLPDDNRKLQQSVEKKYDCIKCQDRFQIFSTIQYGNVYYNIHFIL